ncbi:MAG: cytochrome c family protein [Sphingomonadales bacterium]|jgi:cytochrome c
MSKTPILIAALAMGFAAATPVSAFADEAVAMGTALSSQGDASNGKKIFNQCRACHNVSKTARHKIGPNLYDIFGREAGSVEDFTRYSKALASAEFKWTEEKVDQWLANPRSFLPGNKMSYAGLRKEQDRKDVIAYLRQATPSEADNE